MAIALNILHSIDRLATMYPECSFFGIYDGHAGSECADFLRNNLHLLLINELAKSQNPEDALKNAISTAEQTYLKNCQTKNNELIRVSGSCAVILLIYGDICYIANVGDSRAILSM